MCFCQIIWSVEKEESLSWHEREALLKVKKGSLAVQLIKENEVKSKLV